MPPNNADAPNLPFPIRTAPQRDTAERRHAPITNRRCGALATAIVVAGLLPFTIAWFAPGTAKGALGATPACSTAYQSLLRNVLVNCPAEDAPLTGDQQLDQDSPASIIVGKKVVVVYFDDNTLQADGTFPAWGQGYSVSHNGGNSFIDEGELPQSPEANNQAYAGTLAADAAGNVWLATQSNDPFDAIPPAIKSTISLYEMPYRSDSFQLVSVPDVDTSSLAEGPAIAIGRDGQGHEHFFITFTSYSTYGPSPIVLLDTTDPALPATGWRHTVLTSALCEPFHPAPQPVPDGATLFVAYHALNADACTTNPSDTRGEQRMLTVEVASATVTRDSLVAHLHGSGDAVTAPTDPNCFGKQVIVTSPSTEGLAGPSQSATLDHNGVLYDVWDDRPLGVGGPTSNATRIYLSYSTDANRTWSTPHVISGPRHQNHMDDRFLAAASAGASTLNAVWSERVTNPAGGPDLIREDSAAFTLAEPGSPSSPIDGGEKALSTTAFPVLPTVQSGCFAAGNYQTVSSQGRNVFAAWTDTRNQIKDTEGQIVNQQDIYGQAYQAPEP
jgi:hypothetical protein